MHARWSVVILAVCRMLPNPCLNLVIVLPAEPNLLSHTAHSISRKGVKKRDMNDVELRDILADLLPCVRTDHVIPADSEILTNAIKRGLISVPPSHMIGSELAASSVAGGRSSASAWVRTRNTSLFVRPRLFTPYYDEVKVDRFDLFNITLDSVSFYYSVSLQIIICLFIYSGASCPLGLTRSPISVSSTFPQQHHANTLKNPPKHHFLSLLRIFFIRNFYTLWAYS